MLHYKLGIDCIAHHFGRRFCQNFSRERSRVYLYPFLGFVALNFFLQLFHVFGLEFVLPKSYHIPDFQMKGRDVNFFAVNLKKSMSHELARLVPGVCKTKPVNRVVQPGFQKLNEVVARNSGSAQSFFIKRGELFFH